MDSVVDPTAVIVGIVHLGEHTYLGPFARVEARAPFQVRFCGQDNLQDSATICAFGRDVVVGQRTSIAHGARVVDAAIGDFAFIGFNAQVENATIADGAMVLHGARVRGVKVPPNRIVPPGAVITSQIQTRALEPVTHSNMEFKDEVVSVNTEFARGYGQMFADGGEVELPSISARPKTSWVSEPIVPNLGKNVRLAGPARIIGSVDLGDGCFLGQRASIRGDEGGPIAIGSGAVIGRQVTFHSLLHQTIRIGDRLKAGDRAIFHGGLIVGNQVTVGEGAILFHSTLGSQVTVGRGAIVMGVDLADGARVPEGACWLRQEDACQ